MGNGLLSASFGNDDSKQPAGHHRGQSNTLPREINSKLMEADSADALLALIDNYIDDMNGVNTTTALNR